MQEIADAFLEDANGGARSLDASAGSKPGNSQIKFRVTGTAVGAHTYDQASFYFQVADTVIAATTYVLATVTPSVSRFSNAQVSDYLTFSPMFLRNINIVGANSAAAVSSIEVQPIRTTPMGQSQSDSVYASSFQTATDFQNTRVQIPIGEVVDGYSSIRIINNAEATAVTYNVTHTFGPRLDRRLDVPRSTPAVIRSPGAPK